MPPPSWRLQLFRLASPVKCRQLTSWASQVSNPSSKFQIYTSKSRDPYINLSIEHHLFQKAPQGSKILFLYINRPCVVIGRNQNPWREVNLNILHEGFGNSTLHKVDLVRRRSGGGTVFHDEGNVNWSVICDFMEFTRDKHAEMVVRALRGLGVQRARVNERHDIVLDQGEGGESSDPNDTHSTAFTSEDVRPLKVSGSAYKMARNRALHHGTALLNSPNLGIIPKYLHSPAKSFITAKGVESVSSPVANIGISNSNFMDAVREAFTAFYNVPSEVSNVDVDSDALEIPDIRKGHDELISESWTFLQTPQFTFSLPDQKYAYKPGTFSIDVQHGVIKESHWIPQGSESPEPEISAAFTEGLQGVELHGFTNWDQLFRDKFPDHDLSEIAREINEVWSCCEYPPYHARLEAESFAECGSAWSAEDISSAQRRLSVL